MSKHTPGPWLWEHRETNSGMFSTQVFDQRGETVATCAWYPIYHANGSMTTNRDDNARLIAAAPEMLEALKRLIKDSRFMREEYSDMNWAVEQAEAIIAKAEGR